MKVSNVFGSNPWSRIHFPLPQTPRQSQQLLNALTSSFRRELDREHPPTASSPDEVSGVNNASNGHRLNEVHPQSSVHATEQHLRTLLDNPLFRVSLSTHGVRSQPQLDADGLRPRKEPMVIFDELVASGSATVASVSDCLNWQLLIASRHSGEEFVKALRDSQAGSRVFSWWSSSDSMTKRDFITNVRAVRSTCKAMAAEGLQSSVLAWLKMLGDCNVGGYPTSTRFAETNFKYLLGNFLKAEVECGGGIGSSLRFYLDACRVLVPMSDGRPRLSLKIALGAPAAYLIDNIDRFFLHQNTELPIPVDLYDEYAQMVSMLELGKLQSAIIAIHHPTRPDAQPFVQFLHGIRPADFELWPQARRTKIVRKAFDALRVLTEAGKPKDVLYVTKFLAQHTQPIHTAQGPNSPPVEEEPLRALLDPKLAL
ncbi:uncharacterized protein DSM5745_03184 [Aspergillus mulundensis]|uniref:Uncharacterized protein n=1 Tax=Aspergillus mulundensis TaxID=1810919 RepID=A0A3D8SJV6_9EURO|nr:hypothetical protein DSM5745_03184 [Aspergillus mulundensis]RDW86542.1 hypothetical protein DSM5745_03184 [Aspergillus mulundensis]